MPVAKTPAETAAETAAHNRMRKRRVSSVFQLHRFIVSRIYVMVVLHPDSPLRCTECGNKQLTVTFSKNPQSSTFERWYVLVSAIPCRTSRVYVYIFSSAPEKPNMGMRRFGLEFGRRTSLRETIQSNRPTTPQARHLRRAPRRVRDHDYDVCRHTAPKFRLFHAPANSAQAIAAVHRADRATVTSLSPQTQN